MHIPSLSYLLIRTNCTIKLFCMYRQTPSPLPSPYQKYSINFGPTKKKLSEQIPYCVVGHLHDLARKAVVTASKDIIDLEFIPFKNLMYFFACLTSLLYTVNSHFTFFAWFDNVILYCENCKLCPSISKHQFYIDPVYYAKN